MTTQELTSAVVAALIFVGLGTGWALMYVMPNDALTREIMGCVADKGSRTQATYKACHNLHVEQANGLVAAFNPVIP